MRHRCRCRRSCRQEKCSGAVAGAMEEEEKGSKTQDREGRALRSGEAREPLVVCQDVSDPPAGRGVRIELLEIGDST